MSFSIHTVRGSLLEGVREALAPLVRELRSASAALPVLVGAEHKRVAAIRERLAEIECEIEEILTRRNSNARSLDSLGNLPKSQEPASTTVAFPIMGKWGRS